MTDYIDRQTIIDTVHSAMYSYFCESENEDILSNDEKLLLSVNKRICTAIKLLPPADVVKVENKKMEHFSEKIDIGMLKQCKQEVLNCYTKLKESGILQNKAVRYSLVEYSLLQAVNKLSVAIEDLEDDENS